MIACILFCPFPTFRTTTEAMGRVLGLEVTFASNVYPRCPELFGDNLHSEKPFLGVGKRLFRYSGQLGYGETVSDYFNG